MKYVCSNPDCGAIVLSNPARPASSPPPDGLCATCGGRSCPAHVGTTRDGHPLICGKAKHPDDVTCHRAQCQDWAKRRARPYSSTVAQFKAR